MLYGTELFNYVVTLTCCFALRHITEAHPLTSPVVAPASDDVMPNWCQLCGMPIDQNRVEISDTKDAMHKLQLDIRAAMYLAKRLQRSTQVRDLLHILHFIICLLQ